MSSPSLESPKICLIDCSNPIAKRTHAAFLFRTNGSLEAAQAIGLALQNKADSALIRHELAYILGQMQVREMCGLLENILRDETDDVLVRHESAEALGATGDNPSLDILKEFSTHCAPEISETCQIAIDLIQWRTSGEQVEKAVYLSVDPAPGFSNKEKSIAEYTSELLDESKSLFHRYRAMFALRNLNTNESAMALINGFEDKSALFRHEIAYVLGQMQRSVTIDGLSKVLRDKSEHRMVRHEAAEALGAIGGEVVEAILNEYRNDGEQVVEESCIVVLDTMDYWNDAKF